MTRSQVFRTAHEIARFKDEEKVGNKIFRFLPSHKYAAKFAAALKYVYKNLKGAIKTESNRGKRSHYISNAATLKQFDLIQKLRRKINCEMNYDEFSTKYTKVQASRFIEGALTDDQYYTL